MANEQAQNSILVVDDEDGIRDLVATTLQSYGHVVFSASNAEQAMRLVAQETSIAGAIIDIVMPGISGLELSDRLARTHPKIKKIFMTGFTEANLGGLKVFKKPFDVFRLMEAIQKEINYVPAQASQMLGEPQLAHSANVDGFLSKVETIERMVSAIPYLQNEVRSTSEALRILAIDQQFRLESLKEVGEGTKAVASLMSEQMVQFKAILEKQRADYANLIERRDQVIHDTTKKQNDEVINRFQDFAATIIGRKFMDFLWPSVFMAIIWGIAYLSSHFLVSGPAK